MLTIWHNPRCSKSRQTLALLEENGHTPEVRRYLDDAPTEAELRTAAAALGVAPIDMMRTKEAEFKAEGLTKDSNDDTLFAAMARVPKLIERPMVFSGDKAAIGRPPKAVLDIL
ncbi:arsenate reductase (glutaredoxin) [Alisedimentitalea sp. MJ-SS2]|uniref:arsenate reductase (glutaredoxin) n=1 Tax=Aliisedimentitalea sp. MJ-SS2 TaxID=3049795 RepID=UPI002913120C|nr:arsenate reductase (glutaredoxin) [Alisedimentitalea sp. MJ-SS2]MDU8927394.1 arsenate reductase (glutaredoxin) [Alisedimentitalea sp. MJ-SS2]